MHHAPALAPPLVPDLDPEGSPLRLADLLGRLGTELDRMGRAGHALQEATSVAFGPATAPEGRAGPAVLVAMQGLDALTQEVEALAAVARSLSDAVPAGWLVARRAVGPVPLAALDRALVGDAPPSSTPARPEREPEGPWIEL